MNGRYDVGDIVLHNWTLTRLIGAGSYGKVFEARRKDFGGEYSAAVKIIVIPQTKEEVNEAMSEGMTEESVSEYFRSFVEEISKEFALMSKLKGDSNIVSYEDHEVIPHTDGIGWDIIIRMELLTPFSTILKTEQLTKEDIVKLGIDICRALELCQQHNIIHRDIKPDNIFRSETGHYKLGDFGVARTIDKTTGGLSKKGTYNYMAPEVYREEPYGATVDIYSLGIVLYRLLNNNRVPFLPEYPKTIRHSDREAALARRMGGEEIPYPANEQGRLAEITLKACAYQPKDRYSSPTEMREELEALLNGTEIISGEKGEETVYDGAHIYRSSGTGRERTGTGSVTGGSSEGNRKPEPKKEPEQTPAKSQEGGRKPGSGKRVLAIAVAFIILLAGVFGVYKMLSGRNSERSAAVETAEPAQLPEERPAQTPVQTSNPTPKPTPAATPVATPEPTPTPHIHDWVEATCTEAKTCKECGETEGEPLGHTEVVDPAVEPTCTTTGLTEGKHCPVCNKVLVEQREILALGHSWTEATCTEPKTCAVCGITEGTPLGHDWREATIEAPKTCMRCNLTEGEPLSEETGKGNPDSSSFPQEEGEEQEEENSSSEATGFKTEPSPVPHVHTEVIDEAKAPTCTEPGLTEGKHCAACDEVLIKQEEIPALGHDWTEATCTEPSTCTRCGATRGQAAGHSWAGATCTEPKTCTVCGATDGKPLGHTELIDPAVEPSCTETGLTEGKHCSVCGKVLVEQEKVPALGHNWTEATCTEPSTCTRCGATRGQAAGHSWARATCTEPKTCTVCGAMEGAPLGHMEVIDPAEDPTCTEPGLTEGKHCAVCDEVLMKQEKVPALGHDWTEATCTEPSTCTRCGATRGQAAGHGWARATCTEPKTCTVCGATDGKPLGHTEIIDPAVEPSCTEKGLTEGKHCSVCGKVLVEQEEIPALGHIWQDATCTEPKTCAVCKETEGKPLGHDWQEATVNAPKTCFRCGATEGEPLPSPTPQVSVPDMSTPAPAPSPVLQEEKQEGEYEEKKVRKLSAYVREGDIVAFGAYEQDAFLRNGEEPIEWQILRIENSRALLVSRYALENMKFETEQNAATWETSSLRAWLNQDFFNIAFGEEEKTAVLETEVHTEVNPKYGGFSESNTVDKVFLLSIQEAKQYFSSDNERACLATHYLLLKNGGSVGTDYEGNCWWWLRTSGNGQENAAGVTMQGVIHNSGDSIHNENICVRPALWVDLSHFDESGGWFQITEAEEAVEVLTQADPEKADRMAEFFENAEEKNEVAASGYVSFG